MLTSYFYKELFDSVATSVQVMDCFAIMSLNRFQFDMLFAMKAMSSMIDARTKRYSWSRMFSNGLFKTFFFFFIISLFCENLLNVCLLILSRVCGTRNKTIQRMDPKAHAPLVISNLVMYGPVNTGLPAVIKSFL